MADILRKSLTAFSLFNLAYIFSFGAYSYRFIFSSITSQVSPVYMYLYLYIHIYLFTYIYIYIYPNLTHVWIQKHKIETMQFYLFFISSSTVSLILYFTFLFCNSCTLPLLLILALAIVSSCTVIYSYR